MRAEFDGAALDRWLEREAELDDWSLEMEEETIEQARERMTVEEAAADAAWEQGR